MYLSGYSDRFSVILVQSVFVTSDSAFVFQLFPLLQSHIFILGFFLQFRRIMVRTKQVIRRKPSQAIRLARFTQSSVSIAALQKNSPCLTKLCKIGGCTLWLPWCKANHPAGTRYRSERQPLKVGNLIDWRPSPLVFRQLSFCDIF